MFKIIAAVCIGYLIAKMGDKVTIHDLEYDLNRREKYIIYLHNRERMLTHRIRAQQMQISKLRKTLEDHGLEWEE